MPTIRLLPPQLANKIAAGEVVERPASVVKELVENSIDAGAKRVEIALTDAGKTLIRVADDGCGIEASDLPLAFSAHATSKISSVEDLFTIETNGFRGEALASIQAVARVRMITSTGGTPWTVEATADEVSAPIECPGSPGTVIEVRDLFYNVPARRRWLKSDASEFSHIVEIVQAIAAANPEIGFTLKHGERTALEAPPAQAPAERVRQLFGDRFREGMLEVNEHESYARLTAFLAPPNVHRPNSKAIKMFVNRRPIRDRSMMQAVMLGYREFIPPGRYPVGVFFIDVDPTTIDVNVHPAKTEVRFLDQNRIFSLIKASIVEKIIHSGLLPAMPLKAADDAPAYLPQARPDSPFEPNWDVQERRMFGRDAEVEARGAHERWTDARHVLDEAFRVVDPAPAHRLTEAPSQTPVTDSPAPTAETGLLAKARGLFQVGATYIMVETEDGVIVIDQHAYHERILYWQLENRIASGPPERQRLLAPMPLDLSSSALELARGHLEQLAEFGFVLEPFGADGLALTATPKYSRPDKHAEVIQSICEDLAAGRKPSGVEGMRKSMVESVACKAAIKAGDVLSPQQIRDLLRLGETVPHTFACPHGRPTTYKLGFIDLEKIFHRR